MQYRSLGNSGLKVSVISLGSWLTFGNTVGASETSRVIAIAFERGVNLFDTADVYKNGEGEKALGQAIRSLSRNKLVIASKCFFPMSDDVNDRGLSRKHVHESIDGSLRRLGTDYLDLYQCHRFDPETPLLETATAMDDLIRRGKTLYWGVSQWPAERIVEVVDLCRREHLHAPISNQPVYNLFDRGIETAVIPTSSQCGVSQIVYSPLAQGVLTGKYRPGAELPRDSRAADARVNQFLDRFLLPECLQRAAVLAALAEQHSCSSAQLALAFCLRLPNVASTIVGARTETQLLDNLGAAELLIQPPLLAKIEDLFPA
jgi:aryl-alcohol dehydrogenase-like predicted oxidoreductase